MRPAMRVESMRASSSMLVTGTTSASSPASGVATLPPSATATRGCGHGETTSTAQLPRIQCGTVTGSACTFFNPSARSRASAHSTARASPGEPAERGPTSRVSERKVS
jgi:hypothetical protein